MTRIALAPSVWRTEILLLYDMHTWLRWVELHHRPAVYEAAVLLLDYTAK